MSSHIAGPSRGIPSASATSTARTYHSFAAPSKASASDISPFLVEATAGNVLDHLALIRLLTVVHQPVPDSDDMATTAAELLAVCSRFTAHAEQFGFFSEKSSEPLLSAFMSDILSKVFPNVHILHQPPTLEKSAAADLVLVKEFVGGAVPAGLVEVALQSAQSKKVQAFAYSSNLARLWPKQTKSNSFFCFPVIVFRVLDQPGAYALQLRAVFSSGETKDNQEKLADIELFSYTGAEKYALVQALATLRSWANDFTPSLGSRLGIASDTGNQRVCIDLKLRHVYKLFDYRGRLNTDRARDSRAVELLAENVEVCLPALSVLAAILYHLCSLRC